MTKRMRRNHTSAFMAKIAVAALRGDQMLAELAEQYDVHPNQVQDWKKRPVEGADDIFGGHAVETEHKERKVEKLHTKIGQLAMEKDFVFGESARARPLIERRAKILMDHRLPKAQRCELLDVPRSTAYYEPTPVSAQNLVLMRLIDESYLQCPFYGSRQLRGELEVQGHLVNRMRMQKLM